MVDPLSILGLSIDAIKDVRALVKNKVSVTPKVVEFPQSNWEVIQPVFICNNTQKPLFDVQVAIWQELRLIQQETLPIKLVEVEDQHKGISASLHEISVNTGILEITGNANGIPVVLLMIDSLYPGQCRRILLQTSHQSVKTLQIDVVSLSNKPSNVLRDQNRIAVNFEPPFNFQLESMGLMMKRSV